MKTLNEVIKDLEKCITDDAIESEGGYLATDALHYLREYRTLQTAYITVMADAEDNPPLSWLELRHIDDEPLWLEVMNGEKKWVITLIDPDDDNRIYVTDAYGLRGALNMPMYLNGKIQCYRKKRK